LRKAKAAVLWYTALVAPFLLWSFGCGRADSPVAAGNANPAPPMELSVQAERVRTEEWLVVVPVSGDLRSQSTVEVKTEVGGKLMSVFFEEGSSVPKGQVLAELDPVNYQLAGNQAKAALSVAEAGVERARVVLDHARREKERADNLLRTGGITEKDHQAATTSVKEAESQLRLAEAQSEQAHTAVLIAEKSLRDCRIVAPAAGRVQRKFFDVGSLLAPGSPVCVLVDNARLELVCDLPSYRLAEVRPGQTVSFATPTWEGRLFAGRVHSISPMLEAENRAAQVIVKISNPREELRSGMFARGEIEVRRVPGALVIPRPAFMAEQEDSAQGTVFVVEGGRAVRRPVQLADSRKDQLWVQQGLKEGDLVVVQVGPALKEGAAVRVEAPVPEGS
jgi:RND family efflux transporter MFP subunit